jgi:hypothetical protein
LFRKYAAGLALGLPLCLPFAACSAEALQVACDTTVKSFFTPLVQRNLINRSPFMVDEHSLNHFRPRDTAKLTAYGMAVTDVIGYSDEPLLFIKKGKLPTSGEVYGVVVEETIANVQAHLASVGVTQALTYRFDANSTAIACKVAAK